MIRFTDHRPGTKILEMQHFQIWVVRCLKTCTKIKCINIWTYCTTVLNVTIVACPSIEHIYIVFWTNDCAFLIYPWRSVFAKRKRRQSSVLITIKIANLSIVFYHDYIFYYNRQWLHVCNRGNCKTNFRNCRRFVQDGVISISCYRNP